MSSEPPPQMMGISNRSSKWGKMYRRYIRGEISHSEKFHFFSAYCTHASEGGDLPYSTGMFYNETAMLYSKSGAGYLIKKKFCQKNVQPKKCLLHFSDPNLWSHQQVISTQHKNDSVEPFFVGSINTRYHGAKILFLKKTKKFKTNSCCVQTLDNRMLKSLEELKNIYEDPDPKSQENGFGIPKLFFLSL